MSTTKKEDVEGRTASGGCSRREVEEKDVFILGAKGPSSF